MIKIAKKRDILRNLERSAKYLFTTSDYTYGDAMETMNQIELLCPSFSREDVPEDMKERFRLLMMRTNRVLEMFRDEQ